MKLIIIIVINHFIIIVNIRNRFDKALVRKTLEERFSTIWLQPANGSWQIGNGL
jgi:hypothetical protein